MTDKRVSVSAWRRIGVSYPEGYQDSAQGGGFTEPWEQGFDTRPDFRVPSPITRVPLLRCSKFLIDT